MELIPNNTDLTGLDCHTHSVFSPDSDQTPESLVTSARARGLRGFIVTDHIDVDRWGEEIDLVDYFKTWERVRRANPDLKIYIGLEAGFELDTYKRTYKLIKDFPFEYLITSVHYVPGAWYAQYDGGREKTYRKYINAVLDSLDAPWGFNTVGHFGFFERYAPYPQSDWVMDYETFAPLMDEVIKKALERGVRFEENTKGGEIFRLPRADFLRAYKAAGGVRPVLGSDAHSPDAVAHRFDEAATFLDGIFGKVDK